MNTQLAESANPDVHPLAKPAQTPRQGGVKRHLGLMRGMPAVSHRRRQRLSPALLYNLPPNRVVARGTQIAI